MVFKEPGKELMGPDDRRSDLVESDCRLPGLKLRNCQSRGHGGQAAGLQDPLHMVGFEQKYLPEMPNFLGTPGFKELMPQHLKSMLGSHFLTCWQRVKSPGNVVGLLGGNFEDSFVWHPGNFEDSFVWHPCILSKSLWRWFVYSPFDPRPANRLLQ